MSTETVWTLPEPLATRDVRLDDNTVTTVRRHGNPSGPRLILSHANGLAIDLYYPFWSLFADDFDVVIYDLRNHGWNTVGPRRDHNIPTLIHDHDLILESVSETWGRKPTFGIIHSVSTLVTILAATHHYSGLILFDPPLCKPAANESQFDAAAERTAALTRRRSETFRSMHEFVEVLTVFPAFSRVVPGVRELMASATLRPRSNGDGYELRCPREYEAQISEYIRGFAPLLDLSLLSCPTKVIGADPTLPYAYLPTFDLSQATAVDYDFVPEATHLLQLERPGECAALVREFIEDC